MHVHVHVHVHVPHVHVPCTYHACTIRQARLGRTGGSVDLLITGCEVSLWLGEQFAADVHHAFPRLKVVTISANKLLGQLGQQFPVPQVGSFFHCESLIY